MSDVASVALITGGVGVINLLVTLWFSRRTRQLDLEARARERREDGQEWYRRTLFEKQLQAAQEAYEWLMKLNRGINLADSKNPDAEWTKTLKQTCLDAREWYDRNTVFLHGSLPSRSEFIGLINAAGEYSQGQTEHLRIWQFYRDAEVEVKQRLREVMSGRRSEEA